ncbi:MULTISPECIES: UxaA family hydrolase [Thermodesulfovibrio]|uniref:Altronate dehydratase small subunit n=2 Tax=Thermodesulfovibrio TaxID=28261 RepID=A0A0U9HN66_9BACT|nr:MULTISPECIES: UxaA family hydrolase [Thermodesulfovibrio]GAQ94503.1 altronate dehydratase small subunit [Thermodesulfovibrio aggregans]GLI52369.1 dehydratase [Thermodesulfovibrio islandicus]
MRKVALLINQVDNVVTALTDLSAGDEVSINVSGKDVKIKLLSNIRFGHKFAIADIKKGENVIKYGEVIGRAITDIKKGEHVHVHNIESLRGRGDWQ